jgi:RNA polymerase sigma-70 factor (ECF subfamily)
MDELDAKIMFSVARGDLTAFGEVVERYQKPLINFVSKFTGDRSAAEDIAQEVFLRVFKAAGDYTPKARFKTWLFKIAANYCLNEIRRSKSRPRFIAPFDLNEAGFIAIAPDSCDPGKALETKEIGCAVRRAIANLPEKQRIAVLLQRYNGFSYQEISHMLGCSVPAVESLIQRARQSLKKQLIPYL